jgi:hypothetical protein
MLLCFNTATQTYCDDNCQHKRQFALRRTSMNNSRSLQSLSPNCMLGGRRKVVQRCNANRGAQASEDSSKLAVLQISNATLLTQSHAVRVLAPLRDLETCSLVAATVTDQSSIDEEINSGYIWYHSFQNLFNFHLLPERLQKLTVKSCLSSWTKSWLRMAENNVLKPDKIYEENWKNCMQRSIRICRPTPHVRSALWEQSN